MKKSMWILAVVLFFVSMGHISLTQRTITGKVTSSERWIRITWCFGDP